MSEEQFLVLVSALKAMVHGQRAMAAEVSNLRNEVESLKAEVARLNNAGSEVDKMNKLGRKISN